MHSILDPKFLKRIHGTMVCLTCAILCHSLRALQTGVYKKPPNFNPEASFSSAPPQAIEISTLWEIIVRVSSASSLPLWLLPRSTMHPSFPFLSLGSLASPLTGFLMLSSLSTLALMFLPLTPHFPTRFA